MKPYVYYNVEVSEVLCKHYACLARMKEAEANTLLIDMAPNKYQENVDVLALIQRKRQADAMWESAFAHLMFFLFG